MATFWIATGARTGSTWLARLLDQSPTHTVRHETADDHQPTPGFEYYERFPVERFGPNYGECHGHLRRYLSPATPGREREIPRRFVLLRSKRKIVASWMNQTVHSPVDFVWVVVAVCRVERLLLDYAAADPGCQRLELEQLSASVSGAQSLVDDLDLGFRVTPAHLEPFNRTRRVAWKWSPRRDSIYGRLAKHFADVRGID